MRPLMLLLLLSVTAAAGFQPSRPVSVEVGGANLPAQRIGPNDLIAVSVYDSPELTRTIRISSEGSIRLPMLKQKIRAEGLMPGELEAAIGLALAAEQILVDPIITVTVVEYHSRPISVAGAVKRPLTFQAYGVVTLLDALTRAEGLGPEAGPEILVSRAQPGHDGQPATLIQRIPVKGLIDAADPELNMRLYGGEEIRVPEVGKVFVVGNVKRPGAFPVQDVTDTTVLKLLALAEGLMPYAAKQAFIYRRELGSATKNEIPIELEKIIRRKASDVHLQPNDILYIPDNKGRRVGLAALEKILLFGSTAGATALVYGQIR